MRARTVVYAIPTPSLVFLNYGHADMAALITATENQNSLGAGPTSVCRSGHGVQGYDRVYEVYFRYCSCVLVRTKSTANGVDKYPA